MSLTSTLSVSARASQTNAIDLGTSRAERTISDSLVLTNGTGTGAADLIFSDTRTLAASATEDLDLAGALVDAFGNAQVFVRVKALVVQAAAANTNNVQVSRPAAAGWATPWLAASDGIQVRPGATLALIAGVADSVGYVVTATTADLLTITNSAGTTGVTYSIMIFGCSA